MSKNINEFIAPTQTSDCKNYFPILPLAVTCVVLCGLNFLCASKKATKENISEENPMICNNGKFANGFTLVELIITLAIAALLMTVAVPSFTSMVQNNRLTTQANQFVSAMQYARTEAIKRKVTMNILATDPSNLANEWGPGWRIVDNTAATVKTIPALPGSTTLNSAGTISTFQYQSNGRVNVSDTLTLCDNRSGETGREITIKQTGRISTKNFSCP